MIASAVYTVALPFAAIATTFLYYDVRTRVALAATAAKPADVLPAEIASASSYENLNTRRRPRAGRHVRLQSARWSR